VFVKIVVAPKIRDWFCAKRFFGSSGFCAPLAN